MLPVEHKNLSLELQAALAASRRAAELVMPYYTGGVEVEYKPDATPVTRADREAEQTIIEELTKHFPDYAILGEESGSHEKESPKTWIIDPIDGTKNFIRRIPLFGIEIGLLDHDQFTTGVSNMPAMNEILYAAREDGAFCNGTTARVSRTGTLKEAAITFSGLNLLRTRGHDTAFHELAETVYRVRGFGDAFSFHLVATGRFDAVVQSRVNVWDVAGLVAIIHAAGGRCTDWEGRPFSKESKSIIASNGLIHDQVIAILNARSA